MTAAIALGKSQLDRAEQLEQQTVDHINGH
jgi:hypothetical protein